MKSIVDKESSPSASPYSRRHPRRILRINKIATTEIQSVSNVVNRISAPVDATIACKRNDENDGYTITANDSVVFNFDSAQEGSPNSRLYPASTDRNMR